jgi:hypothetical protein
MPGDPKECRRHAARCAELAVAARTPQLKAAFLGLSKNWETLAIQLEDTFGILEELELVGSNVRQSLDETKRLLLSQKSSNAEPTQLSASRRTVRRTGRIGSSRSCADSPP